MTDILKFDPRKVSNARLKEHLERSDEALNAALNNEAVTRGRVDAIERVLGGFLGLSLWHRLKWLLFGMPKPTPVEPEAEKAGPDVH